MKRIFKVILAIFLLAFLFLAIIFLTGHFSYPYVSSKAYTVNKIYAYKHLNEDNFWRVSLTINNPSAHRGIESIECHFDHELVLTGGKTVTNDNGSYTAGPGDLLESEIPPLLGLDNVKLKKVHYRSTFLFGFPTTELQYYDCEKIS